MKCPKCQSENREGIKFCEKCGARMEIKCPSCDAFIPLGKKFCGECGHKLSLPSEPSPGLRSECRVQVLRVLERRKSNNEIHSQIAAGQILHLKAFLRISTIVVIRLCQIYGDG